MENKQIVFTRPCVAELLNVPMPKVGENDVLVKLSYSAISAGTERSNLIGDANVNSTRPAEVSFPRYCGYSCSGIVEQIGSAVKSVKVGDRVACSWSVHAKYCVLKESRVYKLPDSVGFDEGALVHIATFPLGAVRKCHTQIGEPAMVMGLGVLGILSVKLLKSAGAVPIIAVDPVESKRKQAFDLGADYALDPFADDFIQTVKSLTNGGPNVVIEVTGNGSAMDLALDCIKKFGRMALLGCTRNSDFTIDYYRKVHAPGITLIGAHTHARPKNESHEGWWTERDDAQALIKMLELKRINFKTLIEESHSPKKCDEIYTRLANSPSFPIVEFDWSDM